jgi:ankyrin repeat protein
MNKYYKTRLTVLRFFPRKKEPTSIDPSMTGDANLPEKDNLFAYAINSTVKSADDLIEFCIDRRSLRNKAEILKDPQISGLVLPVDPAIYTESACQALGVFLSTRCLQIDRLYFEDFPFGENEQKTLEDKITSELTTDRTVCFSYVENGKETHFSEKTGQKPTPIAVLTKKLNLAKENNNLLAMIHAYIELAEICLYETYCKSSAQAANYQHYIQAANAIIDAHPNKESHPEIFILTNIIRLLDTLATQLLYKKYAEATNPYVKADRLASEKIDSLPNISVQNLAQKTLILIYIICLDIHVTINRNADLLLNDLLNLLKTFKTSTSCLFVLPKDNENLYIPLNLLLEMLHRKKIFPALEKYFSTNVHARYDDWVDVCKRIREEEVYIYRQTKERGLKPDYIYRLLNLFDPLTTIANNVVLSTKPTSITPPFTTANSEPSHTHVTKKLREAMFMAIESKDSDTLTKLCTENSSVVKKIINAQDDEGRTLLHVAAQIGFSPSITVLLQQGSNRMLADKEGVLPFHIAIQNGYAACLPYLINSAGAHRRELLQAALVTATNTNNATCVQKLLELGADPTTTDTNGDAPLHHAVREGYIETVNIYIGYTTKTSQTSHAFDIDTTNKSQQTALHVAAMAGYNDIANNLLLHGAKPERIDANKFTALHWAAISSDDNTLQTILNANSKKAFLEMQNIDNQTALQLAELSGNLKCIALLKEKQEKSSAPKKSKKKSKRRPKKSGTQETSALLLTPTLVKSTSFESIKLKPEDSFLETLKAYWILEREADYTKLSVLLKGANNHPAIVAKLCATGNENPLFDILEAALRYSDNPAHVYVSILTLLRVSLSKIDYLKILGYQKPIECQTILHRIFTFEETKNIKIVEYLLNDLLDALPNIQDLVFVLFSTTPQSVVHLVLNYNNAYYLPSLIQLFIKLLDSINTNQKNKMYLLNHIFSASQGPHAKSISDALLSYTNHKPLAEYLKPSLHRHHAGLHTPAKPTAAKLSPQERNLVSPRRTRK